MNKLGVIINLPNDIIELYVEYDFEYFMGKVLDNRDQLEASKKKYKETKSILEQKLKLNKKQALFSIEGAVRKMHSGGLLPSLFEMDETRKLSGMNYIEYGKNWAYFDIWKKYKKRKIIRRKISKSILFFGSILAYILTILKIIELIKG